MVIWHCQILLLNFIHISQISDFEVTKPEKHIVGDIKNKDDLTKAFEGVDTVFHTAGIVSFGTHPDIEGMMRVNVHGKYSLLLRN